MLYCKKCGHALTRLAKPNSEAHVFEETCFENMQRELAEWRSGKRRVYWQIKYGRSFGTMEYVKAGAMGSVRRQLKACKGASVTKLYLVTVGPRGNVRPWRKK